MPCLSTAKSNICDTQRPLSGELLHSHVEHVVPAHLSIWLSSAYATLVYFFSYSRIPCDGHAKTFKCIDFVNTAIFVDIKYLMVSTSNDHMSNDIGRVL